MGVVLAGFCVREDLWGVTSLVRAPGLEAVCYDRLLDFFHSPALNVETLTRLWAALVVNLHPGLVLCNGRRVLVGDGIKIGKAGKKSPASNVCISPRSPTRNRSSSSVIRARLLASSSASSRSRIPPADA
jgi:hypothetical protein